MVAVDDPYGLRANPREHPFDLSIGSFVEVRISGRTLTDVFRLPAAALRQENTVWLFDSADSTLKVADVRLVRREQDIALLSAGIDSGDEVITTYLSGVADGKRLRKAQTEDVR